MWDYAIGAAGAAFAIYAASVFPKIIAAYKSWAEGRAYIDLTNLFNNVKKSWAARPKLSVWLVVGLLSVAYLIWTVPAIMTAVFYKFALTNLGLIWLYWLSVHIWPHSRPSSYMDENGNVNKGEEIQYAASLISQVLFVAIVFHGFAQLV